MSQGNQVVFAGGYKRIVTSSTFNRCCPTPLAPDERSCHAACGGKRRAKPLKQRTRSQVKLALGSSFYLAKYRAGAMRGREYARNCRCCESLLAVGGSVSR